ncbi:hypothetical protein PYJP_01440 [Pyrofollis japonicus]|uniref:hypothetical protein n=1 Tax=Pyrofollis japonicus TaxID=3060460 RepID=UPI00295AE228|nr:hypothetical protein [Pyrofollis japonicus]BEP16792.1 hypothetical protein PYJP_01440 [Pyrofollis japonicus]
MARTRRDVVIDVYADCDQVLKLIESREPPFFFESMGRLIEKGEKKDSYVLTFALPGKGKARVEIRLGRKGDSLVYEFKGDARGETVLTALPRGPRCRVYIEAEAEGKLIDKYGGEALSRVVNRFASTIISMFPASLQPKVPSGKLGDIVVETLKLINMAHTGPTGVKAASIKSIALNLEDAKIINVDGIGEEEAEKIAPKLIELLRQLVDSMGQLGAGSIRGLAIAGDNATIHVNMGGGIAIITILGRKEEAS